MSSFRSRIWDWMDQLIRDFNQRSLSYHGLVQNLEKLMDAAHIEDDAILQVWYKGWKELERFDAQLQAGEGPDLMMVQPSVEKMRTILLECKKISLANGESKSSPRSLGQ